MPRCRGCFAGSRQVSEIRGGCPGSAHLSLANAWAGQSPGKREGASGKCVCQRAEASTLGMDSEPPAGPWTPLGDLWLQEVSFALLGALKVGPRAARTQPGTCEALGLMPRELVCVHQCVYRDLLMPGDTGVGPTAHGPSPPWAGAVPSLCDPGKRARLARGEEAASRVGAAHAA